jgi:hypothetical protein
MEDKIRQENGEEIEEKRGEKIRENCISRFRL